jgi:hypothetical protein
MFLWSLFAQQTPIVIAQKRASGSFRSFDYWSQFRSAIRDRWDVHRITRIFGSPTFRYSPKKGELTLGFDKASGLINHFSFHFIAFKLESIEVYPEAMTLDEAVKTFGADFTTTRYRFDECLSDGEGAPIFKHPLGNLVYYEYRSSWLYIGIDEERKIVNLIQYSRIPIGADHSACVP